MKKLTQVFGLALVTAAFGFASVASAQGDRAGYATVVRVEGIASYSLGDDVWHPLVAGKKLLAGSTIRTGENGTVDVVLGKQIAFPQAQGMPDGLGLAPDSAVRGLVSDKPSMQQNAVRLLPGTVLAIDKLTINDTGVDTVSDTELNLQKGKIFGAVKKLTPASEYLVKLPNGIAGIRGTDYYLGADDSAGCYSSHSDGFNLVLVIDGQKVSFHIQPGEMLAYGTDVGNHHNGQVVPLTPDIQSLLAQAFATLSSSYHILVNYSENGNNLNISSLTGLRIPNKILLK